VNFISAVEADAAAVPLLGALPCLLPSWVLLLLFHDNYLGKQRKQHALRGIAAK
jgi:hypothetical protein